MLVLPPRRVLAKKRDDRHRIVRFIHRTSVGANRPHVVARNHSQFGKNTELLKGQSSRRP
jgi:hypothetical protein